MTANRAIVVLDDSDRCKTTVLQNLVAAAAVHNWTVHFITPPDANTGVREECEKIGGMVFQAQEKIQLCHRLLDIIEAQGVEPIALALGVPFFGLDLRYAFSMVLNKRFPHALLAPLIDDATKPFSRHGLTEDAARQLCGFIHKHIMQTACTKVCLK